MSTQTNADEMGTVAASIGPTPQYLYHQRRHRNLLSSPLLRLPTEIIIKIFESTIDQAHNPGDDGDYGDSSNAGNGHNCDDGSPIPGDNLTKPLILTAICHKLRGIGITTPYLWSTVDLGDPFLAGLFLERCGYDPHTLIISTPGWRSAYSAEDPPAPWAQLEGRVFNNLHSLVFEGVPSDFNRVVPILQRAVNVSSLDLRNTTYPGLSLPWHPSVPPPRLSVLHLRGFWVSWISSLFRNLTQLTFDCGTVGPFSGGGTAVETFLTVLGNCPDLERLELRGAGPDQSASRRDNNDEVVQLRSLQGLSLEFANVFAVGCILSHIGYPKSASVDVCVKTTHGTRISETIPRVFLRRDTDTFRRFQMAEALIVWIEGNAYEFSTDRSTIRVLDSGFRGPLELSLSASMTLEVVGRNILLLSITAEDADPETGMWEVFLHGLPRLKRVSYRHYGGEESWDVVDPFVLVFSRPFGGELVCPQLERLRLPKRVLTQDSSVTLLKRVLGERSARGRRLKQIEQIDCGMEDDDRLLLEPFRDVVDEIL